MKAHQSITAFLFVLASVAGISGTQAEEIEIRIVSESNSEYQTLIVWKERGSSKLYFDESYLYKKGAVHRVTLSKNKITAVYWLAINIDTNGIPKTGRENHGVPVTVVPNHYGDFTFYLEKFHRHLSNSSRIYTYDITPFVHGNDYIERTLTR